MAKSSGTSQGSPLRQRGAWASVRPPRAHPVYWLLCSPPTARHPHRHPMILEFPSFNIGTTAMRATMRCGASCLRPAQSPKWVMTVTGTGGAPLAVPTHSAAAGSLIAAPMIGTRRRWLDGPAADRQISIRGLRKRAENARARPGRADQAHCASRVAQAPFPCCRPDARLTHGQRWGKHAAPWQYQQAAEGVLALSRFIHTPALL